MGDLEAGRDELVHKISVSGGFFGEDVTIVFDGTSGGANGKVKSGLRIVFSKRPDSADDLIKRLIGDYNNRHSVIVVSSDRSIADYAKECGAKSIKSKDFLSLITTRKNSAQKKDLLSEKPLASTRPDPELLRLFKEEKHEK